MVTVKQYLNSLKEKKPADKGVQETQSQTQHHKAEYKRLELVKT